MLPTYKGPQWSKIFLFTIFSNMRQLHSSLWRKKFFLKNPINVSFFNHPYTLYISFSFLAHCEKLKHVISVVVQALINYVQYKIVLGAAQYTQKQHPTVTSLIIVSFKKHTIEKEYVQVFTF